jgi:hypothetical protein
VTAPHLTVGVADEGREVGPRDVDPEGEHAAAHVVEQHVGEVVGRGQPIGGALEPVGGRDDLGQARGAGGDVGPDLGGQRRGVAQPRHQGRDLGLGLGDVGDDRPAVGRAGGQRQLGLREVRAAPTAHQLGAGQGVPALEGPPLVGDQDHLGRRQAVAPHRRRVQGLEGLGPVDDLGRQRVQRQRGPRDPLGHLEGVDQAARRLLQGLADVAGQEVVQAVEHPHVDRPVAAILDRGRADEPEAGAGLPLGAEAERQVVVVLLEDQAVAEEVLVQPPRDPIGEAIVVAQRPP